jgi:uncharacterized surface protein with fasciclin (FAS1) repeats
MKAPYAEKVLITTPTGLPESQSPRDAQKRADAARAPRWGPKANILEALESAGDFKILAQALKDVHLDDILSGKGPFTLFAPTDEAFAKLPAAELRTLLADPVDLRSVLSYHIVASKVRAPRERVPNTVIAVDGRKLTMTVRQGSYQVNDTQIVKTNLRASNGVIHALAALMPPV